MPNCKLCEKVVYQDDLCYGHYIQANPLEVDYAEVAAWATRAALEMQTAIDEWLQKIKEQDNGK